MALFFWRSSERSVPFPPALDALRNGKTKGRENGFSHLANEDGSARPGVYSAGRRNEMRS